MALNRDPVRIAWIRSLDTEHLKDVSALRVDEFWYDEKSVRKSDAAAHPNGAERIHLVL